MKPKPKKPRSYWAGFADGKLHFPYSDVDGNLMQEAAIYKTRKNAKYYYDDVRRVKIVEIKGGI